MSDKFKNKYRIESNRLQTWDYSAPGGYFLTVCINGRREILGDIQNSQMVMSDAGKIVTDHITKIPEYHQRVILDIWIVMPNHIHLIILLGDYGFHNGICKRIFNDDAVVLEKNQSMDKIQSVEKIHEFSLQQPKQPPPPQQQSRQSMDIKQYRKMRRQMLIPKIMGKFQMLSSKQINILNQTPGNRNWQPNYHDRIIRNENEFRRIQQYIKNNPLNWKNDKNNQDGLWI